jgi:hypothetical protein
VIDRPRTAHCARGALSFAVITISAFGLLAAPAAAAEVTVAVVRDGPGPEDRLVGLIEGVLETFTEGHDTADLLAASEQMARLARTG